MPMLMRNPSLTNCREKHVLDHIGVILKTGPFHVLLEMVEHLQFFCQKLINISVTKCVYAKLKINSIKKNELIQGAILLYGLVNSN